MAESSFRRRLLSQNYKTFTVDTSVYLTFVALENDLTVTFSNELQYFISNNKDWVTLPANTESPSINAGQTISFKANIIPVSDSGVGRFTVSKKFEAMGDPRSLSHGDVMEEIIHENLGISAYQFYKLFYGCSRLIKVPKNFLPSTTLADYCYNRMFYSCRALTTAPELPATTLADSCYDSMFSGCSSLTTAPELPATIMTERCYFDMFSNCTSLETAPELPATELAYSCYDVMFHGCTSLINAPELPATTLADSCYYYMFGYCTSLTTAPALPATTLADSCYAYMFSNCTSLNHIKMLATNISAYACLNNWVTGVASTGTFIKHPNMTSLSTGISGVPFGWIVVNDGEESGGSKIVNNLSYSIGRLDKITFTFQHPVESDVDIYFLESPNVETITPVTIEKGNNTVTTMTDALIENDAITITRIVPNEDNLYIYTL